MVADGADLSAVASALKATPEVSDADLLDLVEKAIVAALEPEWDRFFRAIPTLV